MRSRRLALAAALLALLPARVAAQRTLVIEDFNTELRVLTNGDVEVTETLRPRFRGSWNGIIRILSLDHQTAERKRQRLDVDLVGITDGAGQELEYEASNEGRWKRRLEIWVPGAQDATRTVEIRYVIHNAIRFFAEGSEFGHYDELYWNVTGNDWEVPIERARATIILPESVTPNQSAGYTGPAGSTEQDVDIRARGNTVLFTGRAGFAPGEGLTVATGWPAGVVARPAPVSPAVRGFAAGWPSVLPFLAFFFGYRQWRRKGRDPKARSIVVQYEPPENLSPTEVGTLVDHKVQMHDVTASLVDLAVRGYVHIEKRTSKTLGLFSNTEYVFHLKQPREQWEDLAEHERLYLDAIFKHAGKSSGLGVLTSLFGGGDEPAPMGEPVEGAGDGPTYDSVELSALKNEFYKDLSKIQDAVYDQLVGKGHYDRDPNSAKTWWIVGGIAVAILGGVGAAWIADGGFLPVSPAFLAGGGIVSGVILVIFGHFMPARTEKGARAREAALGFKEFLAKVEQDRYRRMITSPEMFERFLPFAMAFKVEEKWATAFEGMFQEPPRWYTGYDGGHFHPTSFTKDINAMSTAASTTMASSPSGSGGGGSSGGGSGGGGGGGF